MLMLRLCAVAVLSVTLVTCGGGSPAAPSVTATTTITTSTATSTDVSGYTSTTVHYVVPAPVAGLSSSLNTMMLELVWYLGYSLDNCQSQLPRNPWVQTQIVAKILMLANQNLAVDIVTGKRWNETKVTSIDGHAITVSSVFPTESMRGENAEVLARVGPIMPLLERFYDRPFASSTVLVWYGFALGSSDGGNTLNAEDRSGYIARNGPSPYDAMLPHELGHSFMAHESLNQFLELYAYNLLGGATTNPSTWTWTRGWVPGASTNTGVTALLDVYVMIGLDGMQRAYRAIYPLHPAYGAPISSAVIDAFVATVPAAQQDAVRTKLNAVGY